MVAWVGNVGVRKLTPTYAGWNKLPDWMTETQKKNKVGNLIGELRRGYKIANQGSDARPAWALVKKHG
jgi:hypothetical protein